MTTRPPRTKATMKQQRRPTAMQRSARILLLAGTSLASPGWAANPTDPAEELPGVTVTGNYDNGIGKADAASEGSVSSRLIEARPILRTGELLEFVPGVIVTQHSGDGKANQYFLRGFNLDHGTDFATFVDGMPVNMRTHAHGQGYTDLNFLIPELVDRIDYRKGPYRAEDGDFSSAGTARLKLKNWVDGGEVSATYGSHDYARLFAADSWHVAGGHLLAGMTLGYSNGPWDLHENARRVNGVLRYSQGDDADGFSVTAMAYASNWRSTDQIPLRAVQDGSLGRFSAIDPTDGGRTSRYSLSAAMAKPNRFGTFRAEAYAIASRLNLYSNFTYFLDNPDDGDQFEQAEARQVYGANASQSFGFDLAGLAIENVVGVQGRYDRISPIALYTNTARERTGITREDRVREGSIGAYFENRIRWTPWLRSVAGIRHDRYDFRVSDLVPENSGKVRDGITSPKFSLVFGPWAKTEFFANYGQGFHSNDARGVTATVAAGAGDPIERAVPLVKTHGEELGVRSEFIPGLQSSIALWRLKLDSELVFVGDAGDTEPSRASRRHGVEINNHYVAAPWLLFDLDLAFSKARYTQDDPAGNHVPGSIEKVASFGTTILGRGPWSGQFQVRYFGPRPLIEDDSVRSKSTTLASMRVAYAFNRRVKLAIDVFNLFDRKASDIDYYYASRLRGEPAGGVDDIHFHPVEPRTVRATLTARF